MTKSSKSNVLHVGINLQAWRDPRGRVNKVAASFKLIKIFPELNVMENKETMDSKSIPQ